MRIVVQIPCLNEEATIGSVIRDIREATSGLGDVLILVIDDGSTDDTSRVALEAGADLIAHHRVNQGLARAYLTGIAVALNHQADIIVNTDADNQYRASGIPRLVEPIIRGSADMVVGARIFSEIEHFSALKKWLQRFGTWVARKFSGADVRDATSGFRALNREAALRMQSYSDYTYTLETLIQAGHSGIRVTSVPIEINPPTRPSRLIRSMWRYVIRSAIDMIRIYAIYAPLRAHLLVGSVPLLLSALLWLRYFVLVLFVDPERGHVPSLILAGSLALVGIFIYGLGLLGEAMSANRRILEELRLQARRSDAAAGRLQGAAECNLEKASGDDTCPKI